MNRDRLTPARRSWNMSRIRGKHTAPELIVRSLLHRLGYRFRIHKKIPIMADTPSPPRSGGEGRGEVALRAHREKLTNSKNQKSALPPSENQNSIPPRRDKIQKSLTVRPDIVLPKYKTAIFVYGCFWHRHRGCKNCTTPTHRREFWVKKLEGNAARDKIHQRALRKLGLT